MTGWQDRGTEEATPGVEVERIAATVPREDALVTRSGHYLYRVERGTLRLAVEAGVSSLGVGALAFVGAGNRRRLSTGPKGAVWIVVRLRNRIFTHASRPDQLAWQRLVALGLGVVADPELRLPGEVRTRVEGALAELRDCRVSKEEHFDVVRLKGAVLTLVAAITQDRRAAVEGRYPPVLHAAMMYLERNYARRVSIPEVAAAVGLSRSQLHRQFRQAYGRGPAEVLTQVRLEAAAARLRGRAGTEDSILTVAMACGFGSQSRFYEAFRTHFGMTPGAFARAVRPGTTAAQEASSPRPRASRARVSARGKS